MVLTGDIVYDFLLVEAGSEERVVEGEQLSDLFLVYHQKGLYLGPTVQH